MNKNLDDESAEMVIDFHQDFIAPDGDVPLNATKCCIDEPHKTLLLMGIPMQIGWRLPWGCSACQCRMDFCRVS